MRQTFHINGYYEGIVEFDDMPRNFVELGRVHSEH